MSAPPGDSSNQAEVRRAGPADIEALVALRGAMFAAMGVAAADDRWLTAAHDWYAARIDDPDYGFFLVVVAGKVVAGGVAAIRDAAPSPKVPQGGDVLISSICTFPEHRGHGFGELAFDAVLAWARSTGVARVELMATAPGRRMYERAGFVEVAWPAMRLDW